MSIGAQKSCSGINSAPSEKTQPGALEHSAASSEARHPLQTESVVVEETFTGWQKSSVNKPGLGEGPFPALVPCLQAHPAPQVALESAETHSLMS